ncbi:hypothetical protein ONZ43_g1591 [Nemania bipapillata]|uniref:Uncharacterized protein n=1 Tax=Nemania bipapillata TaxID=110536 RepID=A0ACC2J3R4_9PEZI|nr:hypothetical protein ONZ43_g1591 [Nemania bipapillata]
MPSAHEIFQALGPVEWEGLDQEDLTTLITDIFKKAHCLVDSIPVPSEDELQSSSEDARELRKEWKEVKINSRENPLGLNIYKLASKDGKGSWFARRSMHDGLSFRKWKTGMEREFAESLKVQGQPGDGKIRGLGADNCVANQTVDGCGKIQAFGTVSRSDYTSRLRDIVSEL